MSDPIIHTWPPYVLSIADAPTSAEWPFQRGTPITMRLDDGDPASVAVWLFSDVWRGLVDASLKLLWTEKTTEASEFDLATIDVRLLRQAAQAAPTPAARRAFEEAATATEQVTTIRSYIKANKWPRTAHRMRQFRCSLAWWGLEQLRRGLTDVSSRWQDTANPVVAWVPASITAYLLEVGSLRGIDLEQFDATVSDKLERALYSEHAIDRRIRDAGKRIRAGSEGHVMAWCLHDMTSNLRSIILPDLPSFSSVTAH